MNKPEITDDVPDVPPAPPWQDIGSAWFDETEQQNFLTVKLSLPNYGGYVNLAMASGDYCVWFRPAYDESNGPYYESDSGLDKNADDWTMGVTALCTGPSQFIYKLIEKQDGQTVERKIVEGHFDYNVQDIAKTFVWHIPKDEIFILRNAMTGDCLTNTCAEVYPLDEVYAVTGIPADRAPNSGYGGDYYFLINNAPNVPFDPVPSDVATGVTVDNPVLSWDCGDPDGDSLNYDVYFGVSNPPPLVEGGIDVKNYETGWLETSTAHYWKIVASDGQLSTEGPVWSFVTEDYRPMVVDAGGPYAGDVDDFIQFNGNAMYGTAPYSYSWAFGDGETASIQNPVHAYGESGTYIVTLTVTDSASEVATDTAQAFVDAPANHLWAVLIGQADETNNGKYNSASAGSVAGNELPSGIFDVWDIYQYLTRCAGYVDLEYEKEIDGRIHRVDHIQVLVQDFPDDPHKSGGVGDTPRWDLGPIKDAKGRQGDMLYALWNVSQWAQEGDQVVIFFAGHGSALPLGEEYFSDPSVTAGGDEYKIPLSLLPEPFNHLSVNPLIAMPPGGPAPGPGTYPGNYDVNKGYLVAPQLREIMADLTDTAPETLILIDSCDAGAYTGMRSDASFGEKGLPLWQLGGMAAFNSAMTEGLRADNRIVITASNDNTFSLGSTSSGSVFVTKFMEVLTGNLGDTEPYLAEVMNGDTTQSDGKTSIEETFWKTWQKQETCIVPELAMQQLPKMWDGVEGEFFLGRSPLQLYLHDSEEGMPQAADSEGNPVVSTFQWMDDEFPTEKTVPSTYTASALAGTGPIRMKSAPFPDGQNLELGNIGDVTPLFIHLQEPLTGFVDVKIYSGDRLMAWLEDGGEYMELSGFPQNALRLDVRLGYHRTVGYQGTEMTSTEGGYWNESNEMLKGVRDAGNGYGDPMIVDNLTIEITSEDIYTVYYDTPQFPTRYVTWNMDGYTGDSVTPIEPAVPGTPLYFHKDGTMDENEPEETVPSASVITFLSGARFEYPVDGKDVKLEAVGIASSKDPGDPANKEYTAPYAIECEMWWANVEQAIAYPFTVTILDDGEPFAQKVFYPFDEGMPHTKLFVPFLQGIGDTYTITNGSKMTATLETRGLFTSIVLYDDSSLTPSGITWYGVELPPSPGPEPVKEPMKFYFRAEWRDETLEGTGVGPAQIDSALPVVDMRLDDEDEPTRTVPATYTGSLNLFPMVIETGELDYHLMAGKVGEEAKLNVYFTQEVNPGPVWVPYMYVKIYDGDRLIASLDDDGKNNPTNIPIEEVTYDILLGYSRTWKYGSADYIDAPLPGFTDGEEIKVSNLRVDIGSSYVNVGPIYTIFFDSDMTPTNLALPESAHWTNEPVSGPPPVEEYMNLYFHSAVPVAGLLVGTMDESEPTSPVPAVGSATPVTRVVFEYTAEEDITLDAAGKTAPSRDPDDPANEDLIYHHPCGVNVSLYWLSAEAVGVGWPMNITLLDDGEIFAQRVLYEYEGDYIDYTELDIPFKENVETYTLAAGHKLSFHIEELCPTPFLYDSPDFPSRLVFNLATA